MEEEGVERSTEAARSCGSILTSSSSACTALVAPMTRERPRGDDSATVPSTAAAYLAPIHE
eukprot:3070932-Pyramimonas_sp.AAC.1